MSLSNAFSLHAVE